MVKQPVDDGTFAFAGLLHVLFGVALGLWALLTNGDDRSLLGALAFFMIISGAALEYVGHRGRVWSAMRLRAANRRNHA